MHRVTDMCYEFRPVTGVRSYCRLRIWQGEDRMVVMMTEPADNPGMSVTNAAEEIATQVVADFGVDPACTRFIEHYPEREWQVHGRVHQEPATYDEVVYEWATGRADNPNWRRLAREDMEALIGAGFEGEGYEA